MKQHLSFLIAKDKNNNMVKEEIMTLSIGEAVNIALSLCHRYGYKFQDLEHKGKKVWTYNSTTNSYVGV